MRHLLDPSKIDSAALNKIQTFNSETVKEVEKAVNENEIVVVGMAQNVVVKKARKALDQAGKTYKYLEYGSYFSKWHPRLAIKLWSGWPTFPQVFIKGKLIGGYQDLAVYLKNQNQ